MVRPRDESVMHFSSPEKLDKQHYYHLLPDSDLKNGGTRRNYGKGKGFIISKPPKHKSQQLGRFHFNKYALAASILASTNSVLLGYDIGVMSGAVLYIKDDLQISSTQQQILVGSLCNRPILGLTISHKSSTLKPINLAR